MSNTNGIATSNWRRGNHVLDGGITRGTVIATFILDSNGKYKYDGHVAVFDGYTYFDLYTKGISVWDQNYVSSLLTGKHRLKPSGTRLNNADSYYVVQLE